MGMANGQRVHKQDNLFTHFPIYVFLGVYYSIHFLGTPFIALWNSLSNSLNKTVNGSKMDTNLQGAYLNQREADAKAQANAAQTQAMMQQQQAKKIVKVNPKLIQSREALINAIEATEEMRSDKPVTYRYEALSPFGRVIKGTFYGFSKTEVYTFLENEGYKVFSIETSAQIEKIFGPTGIMSFFGNKISTKNIVFWLQQLSTYLKAGIPLTDAMRILSRQMGKKNKKIERIFNSIVYNLTLGENFSTSLIKQDDAFPPLLINMIKSAEATGDLEGTLDDMASYYKSIETVRKEMIQALTYPCLVLIFAIAVIIFLLVYLVPQFVDIYETAGAKLNPITQFLVDASAFMKSNLLYVIIAIILTVVLIVFLYKNVKQVRYAMQVAAMKTPIFKNVIIYKEMTVFTKTFSSLLSNNVFITDSMAILSQVTSNEIYREIMQTTINYITRGEKISEAFRDHWAIPEIAYYMMVTGESTGELAEMMGRVSEYYEEQHKLLVNSLKTLIEPMLILFLAVVVGGIMIAILVPMFSLYEEILNS